MKIKYLVTTVLIIFSFYLTDKIMIYINNQNPIMQEILEKQNDYVIEPVNAIIDNNTIIPGINGKEVDVDKTFNKMVDYGYFNDLLYVFHDSTPKLTLNDNLDKIIIKGNPKKNMISLIVNHNEDVYKYLKENNIKFTNLVYLEDKIDKNEKYINGEGSALLFSDLDSILKKNKVNDKICLINYSNLELCKNKDYFLVSYSINMDDNILENINKLSAGDIILATSKTTLNDLKLILKEAKRLDLKIDYLSILISEKN